MYLPLFGNLLLTVFLVSSAYGQNNLKNEVSSLNEENSFKLLIEEVILKSLQARNCIAVITDKINNEIFVTEWYKRFGLFISFIMINIKENEDLLAPYPDTKQSLLLAKTEGCQLYIILLSNGIQSSRLLRYGDRYRVLGTISKYIMLYDNRLFEPPIHYLWKRIINVIFIKAHTGQNTKDKKHQPWFEITTVPFPSPITSVFIPRRLAIWAQNRFRKAVDLFKDKTVDLRNQTLKVVAFSHLPGTAKNEKIDSQSVRASLGQNETMFSGTEVEILQTVSKAMNFNPKIYEPPDADFELWGKKQLGGKFTGIIGEMINSFADIALGDLYYTPYLLDLMDLSVPYNTECLTFLTPEALNDNSWKTLILPFAGIMWLCVILCLILCGVVFYFLAKFQDFINKEDTLEEKPEITIFIKKKQVITLPVIHTQEKFDSNAKYLLMKEQYTQPTIEGQPMGLYQFTEPANSILYTYSMLLLVSLPKLPTGWSLRVFTGWYWLYCLLVVVAYRASMTAILAKPQPRVTIDTIEELLDSKLSYGGWGEINREFFKSVQESATKNLGDNFETVNSSSDAVDRVAGAAFAFYENTYFLKEAVVKRQSRFAKNSKNKENATTSNNTQEARDIASRDRSLHIMSDCIINMPVSIGLQKNSPIKPRVDKLIRRVLEAGLIKKWLDDVMQRVLNANLDLNNAPSKAIMSMKKLYGALVALFVGYFVGLVAFVVEILYFKYKVQRHPNYNKYSRSVREVKKAD